MTDDLKKRLREDCDVFGDWICGEAADRIEELEAKLAWQPMETAPKDGTQILGWFAGKTPWHVSRIVQTHWTGDFWYKMVLWEFEITHWMPLPEPPAGEDRG